MKRELIVTSRPLWWGGETSAMYTGTVIEAMPDGGKKVRGSIWTCAEKLQTIWMEIYTAQRACGCWV